MTIHGRYIDGELFVPYYPRAIPGRRGTQWSVMCGCKVVLVVTTNASWSELKQRCRDLNMRYGALPGRPIKFTERRMIPMSKTVGR